MGMRIGRLKSHIYKMSVANMCMLRWMCSHTGWNKIKNSTLNRRCAWDCLVMSCIDLQMHYMGVKPWRMMVLTKERGRSKDYTKGNCLKKTYNFLESAQTSTKKGTTKKRSTCVILISWLSFSHFSTFTLGLMFSRVLSYLRLGAHRTSGTFFLWPELLVHYCCGCTIW